MNDAQESSLHQLDQSSKDKQEIFLQKIASKLGRSRIIEKPDQPFRGAPEFWNNFDYSTEAKVKMFTANFEAAGGHVVQFEKMEETGRWIAQTATELGAHHILRQDQEELEALDLESSLLSAEITVWNRDKSQDGKANAAEADIGIVIADCAVAYTGSIILLSGQQKGRSVSLLPTALIAIIPVHLLVTRLGEKLVEFDHLGEERLPAGIHFISGPSRSADIENDLTIGVHGPGIVYAVLVNE
ncbi:LutC/YkgG family protein [Paenibacillus segetis]|uniref:Lactate utilization protein C n=1 Tax=Paenibacillus segetis TaxID=1325360 RepID=A0ABQ1YDV0_9BACL|nr:LUD domain-containing protein [Paenibacillus segetis]GGH21082.1 lactate utilization protein C [Paenibacillus segetis]